MRAGKCLNPTADLVLSVRMNDRLARHDSNVVVSDVARQLCIALLLDRQLWSRLAPGPDFYWPCLTFSIGRSWIL